MTPVYPLAVGILVLVRREKEAQRLVHWAALLARADATDLTVACPSTAEEPETREVPLAEAPEGGLLRAAADAVARVSAFLAGLSGPEAEDADDKAAPHVPEFTLLDLQAKDPIADVASQVRKLKPDLLVLGLSVKSKSDRAEDDPVQGIVLRAPCRTLLIRPGEDEEERAENILVPIERDLSTDAALKLAVGLAEAGGGRVTALYVQTQVGEDAELLGSKVLARRVARSLKDPASPILPKVVLADSVREGVSAEAENYDLVLLGTPDEWLGRRLLFSTIPDHLLAGPEGTSVAVLRPAVPITTRLQRATRRLLAARVPQLERANRVSLMDNLQSNSEVSFDFVFLVCMSTLIASLGLVAESVPVIIGAMLVAPLMTPLIGSGLSLVQGNLRFLAQTLKTLIIGFLLGLSIAALLGLIMPYEATGEMEARAHPGLLDLGVAFFSGMAAAYALTRPNLSAALPGVAIAASLIPPVATAGITAVTPDIWVAAGAVLLFFTNVIAIILGAAVSLMACGVRSHHLHGRQKKWAPRTVLIAFLLAAIVAVFLCFKLAEYTQSQVG